MRERTHAEGDVAMHAGARRHLLIVERQHRGLGVGQLTPLL